MQSLDCHERALIDAAVALTMATDVQQVCLATVDAVQRVCGALSTREPQFVADVRAETRWFNPARVYQSGLRSMLIVPVTYDEQPVGVLGVDSERYWHVERPDAMDMARLRGIAALAAAAIRNRDLVESIDQDRDRLRRLLSERRHLRHEVERLRDAERNAQSYTSVIGDSACWRAVLDQVHLVAAADSTVLLIGETGTGKELIARAIHEQSRRRRHPFVAINCAAFPESLVESELFGHERGAFTGAFERKLGKFEVADKGTVLLDEVGELPSAVQSKLLRALQEREVHRVGGTKPVPVNARVIAATNRDLEEALREGSFRRLLARHFLRRFAERQGRALPALTPDAIRALEAYHWPGNIRELQNVIERALILCRSTELHSDLLYLPPRVEEARTPPMTGTPSASRDQAQGRLTGDTPGNVVSFFEAERHAILKALETTGWRISGRSGAAELLGLKPLKHLNSDTAPSNRRRPGPPAYVDSPGLPPCRHISSRLQGRSNRHGLGDEHRLA